jgi:hypothetical protein
MSGSEELAQAEEEQVEGGEDFEGTEDDQELAAMQKELEKAEQQKAELDKLNKMQGSASADSKQSECCARTSNPPRPSCLARPFAVADGVSAGAGACVSCTAKGCHRRTGVCRRASPNTAAALGEKGELGGRERVEGGWSTKDLPDNGN